MTKVMLVEDDKSLREIYGVRLLAEGYDIVSAGDGEEALAMAIKERPQLIISDVMMPKVSGYDMLDILRSTTETKGIRVIMMTALSSEEQRMRAESLGADRYLVKSQVGIEDVVRVVHEVLEDTPVPAPTAEPVVVNAPPTPAVPQAAPVAAPTTPPVPVVTPKPETPVLATPSMPPAPLPGSTAVPVAPGAARPPISNPPKPASLKTRVIQPLNDPSIAPVNINDLLDKELAKEAGLTDGEIPVVATVDQEKAAIEEQLKSFIPPEPTPVEAPAVTQPTPAAPASPSLLPTPGVGNTDSNIPTPAQPVTAAPTAPQTAPAVSIPTPVAPAQPPVPAPAPTVPVPQSPVAQQVPVAPVAVPSAPVSTAAAPAAPQTTPQPAVAPVPASEPVVDLSQLPEVPTVSDTQST